MTTYRACAQEKDEFVDNILMDVAALGVSYQRLTYTSDYFLQLVDLAERLIRAGHLYADDTPSEQMRAVRRPTTEHFVCFFGFAKRRRCAAWVQLWKHCLCMPFIVGPVYDGQLSYYGDGTPFQVC